MKIILIIALFSCVSIIFAQEDIIESKNVQLPKNEIAFSVGENIWFSLMTGDNIGFGSYTFSYHYRPKKWLWYGANFNVFVIQDIPNFFTLISLAPSIRFSYLNKPSATLYSGLSLGLGVTVPLADVKFVPFFQATLFGFSIGKQYFAGGEIGLGFKGLVCANIGKRF